MHQSHICIHIWNRLYGETHASTWENPSYDVKEFPFLTSKPPYPMPGPYLIGRFDHNFSYECVCSATRGLAHECAAAHMLSSHSHLSFHIAATLTMTIVMTCLMSLDGTACAYRAALLIVNWHMNHTLTICMPSYGSMNTCLVQFSA